MPVPKRWFPVSRDLNDDPECWALTKKYGDGAIRVWLEILAIIDKTENHWRLTGDWLSSLSRKCRKKPATVRKILDWMLASGWLEVGESLADGSPAIFRAPKYAKYRRTAESKPKSSISLLSLTSLPEPNLPKHKEENKERGRMKEKNVTCDNHRSPQSKELLKSFELTPELEERARDSGFANAEEAKEEFLRFYQEHGKHYQDMQLAFGGWLDQREFLPVTNHRHRK